MFLLGGGDCHYSCYLAVPHHFWHFLYSLKFLSFLLSLLYPLALNSVSDVFLKYLMITDWKLVGCGLLVGSGPPSVWQGPQMPGSTGLSL